MPYYGGNIILRFDLKKEKVTLDELDQYEALMYEIVKDDFLIDFMGDIYIKVGLDISHFDEYLIKCAHSYHEEKILSSPFCEKVKKDAEYLLKCVDLPKETKVWEIQLEEEINLFILGKKNSLVKQESADGETVNIFEVKSEECEGLIKAAFYAKRKKLSLVKVLLESEKLSGRKMKLGTTYICVSDMEKSLAFYKALLQQDPFYCNDDRWITFHCGNSISLYNKKYDEKLIEKGGHIHFNQAYLDDFYKPEEKKMNNMVIFNFETDDLKEECERIKKLNIGEVSEILYVNVHMPYYYFNLIDPDGNIIEISGPYDG